MDLRLPKITQYLLEGRKGAVAAKGRVQDRVSAEMIQCGFFIRKDFAALEASPFPFVRQLLNSLIVPDA